MTKHVTNVLACLYALASVAMLPCAVISQHNGSTGYCALFAAGTALFALGVLHHAYHHDELRSARAEIEALSRPRRQTPAIDGVVAVALAAACCERWWTSAGAEHDVTSCSRKDTTT